MVSIKDVAKTAGVSPQTVSNYINNPGIVKPNTREIVARAIESLGYIPNASARRLRMRRSNTIAIGIAPVNYSRVYDRLLHALVTEADAHGIRVILYKIDSKRDEIRQFASLTAGSDVDAFVLTDTTHDDPRIGWLNEHQQTFVLFGRPWGVPDMYDVRIPWVDVDGRNGVSNMVRYLILHGRKNIGFIGWPDFSGTGMDRYLGWKETMLEARMVSGSELNDLHIATEDTLNDGRRACVSLLARRPDIDAIVCVSDTIATGAVMALPSGSNVVATGFDNTMSSQSLGFSTIDQPLQACAKEIVRIIQEELGTIVAEEGDDDGKHMLLAPSIVIR